MRLNQLRHFVAVARLGNFRKASQELGISQPALTRSIQNLEQYFNVRLFDRLPGETVPTPYGETVLEWAEETLATSANIKRYVEQLSGATTGELIIGIGTYFADSVLAEALSRILVRFPALKMKIVRATGRNAQNLLLNRQIDIYLGWVDEFDKTDHVSSHTFSTGPIVIFCRKGHPVLQNIKPDWKEIREYPFIAPIVPADIQINVNRYISEITGVEGALIDIEFDSYSEVRKVVELSDCIGGLPESSMNPFLDEGIFQRLPVSFPGVSGKGSISYLKGKTLLPAVEHLIQELMQVVEKRITSLAE